MRSDFDAIFDSAIQAGWPGPFAFQGRGVDAGELTRHDHGGTRLRGEHTVGAVKEPAAECALCYSPLPCDPSIHSATVAIRRHLRERLRRLFEPLSAPKRPEGF
jgi:hypothetical protein